MAYENDLDGYAVDGLFIQNGIDKITIEGKLDITKNRQGLENALKLKRAVDATVEALKSNRKLLDCI
jgi:hypothetical protein